MTLPKRVILPIQPVEYWAQGATHCGAFAVKAVLSAYGLDDVGHAAELHTHPISRMSGSSTSIDYYPGILRSYGLIARAKNATGTDDEKLDTLKSLLAAGNPVIISVANHFDRKTQDWAPLKGLFFSHWLSLWGYDDDEQIFYSYDSLLGPDQIDRDIPAGNKKRDYRTLLKIWTGSYPARAFFGPNSYILIRRASDVVARA
jgi:hypothetical protein